MSSFITHPDLVAGQLHKEIGLPENIAWALMDANFTFYYVSINQTFVIMLYTEAVLGYIFNNFTFVYRGCLCPI